MEQATSSEPQQTELHAAYTQDVDAAGMLTAPSLPHRLSIVREDDETNLASPASMPHGGGERAPWAGQGSHAHAQQAELPELPLPRGMTGPAPAGPLPHGGEGSSRQPSDGDTPPRQTSTSQMTPPRASLLSKTSPRAAAAAASLPPPGPSPFAAAAEQPAAAAGGKKAAPSPRRAAKSPRKSPHSAHGVNGAQQEGLPEVARRPMDRPPTHKELMDLPHGDIAPHFEVPHDFERVDGTWYDQYMRYVCVRHKEAGGLLLARMRAGHGRREAPARVVRAVELQPPQGMEDAWRLTDQPLLQSWYPAGNASIEHVQQALAAEPPGQGMQKSKAKAAAAGLATREGMLAAWGAMPGAGVSWSADASRDVPTGTPDFKLRRQQQQQQQQQSSPTRSRPQPRASSSPQRSHTAPSQSDTVNKARHLGPLGLYQARKRKEERQQESQRTQQAMEQRAREVDAQWEEARKGLVWAAAAPGPRSPLKERGWACNRAGGAQPRPSPSPDRSPSAAGGSPTSRGAFPSREGSPLPGLGIASVRGLYDSRASTPLSMGGYPTSPPRSPMYSPRERIPRERTWEAQPPGLRLLFATQPEQPILPAPRAFPPPPAPPLAFPPATTGSDPRGRQQSQEVALPLAGRSLMPALRQSMTHRGM